MGVENAFKITICNEDSEHNGKVIGDLADAIDLKDLAGERICIDTSWTIYSAVLAMAHVTSLADSSGKTTIHLNTILNKVIMFKKFKIDAIWIFDSPKQNAMKAKEIEKRRKRKKDSKNDKAKWTMTSEHVQDVQELLSKLGVMYITAPDGIEAEQYGAALTSGPEDQRYCKYMLSGDSDVLFFGGNLLRPVKRRTASGKSSKAGYETYNLQTILDEMDVTIEEFVKMGVTLGCDFCDKTPKIGPKTVHSKLAAVKLPALTPEQKEAYFYFLSVFETKNTDLVQNKFDKQGLITMLTSRGFKKDTLEKKIKTAYKLK